MRRMFCFPGRSSGEIRRRGRAIRRWSGTTPSSGARRRRNGNLAPRRVGSATSGPTRRSGRRRAGTLVTGSGTSGSCGTRSGTRSGSSSGSGRVLQHRWARLQRLPRRPRQPRHQQRRAAMPAAAPQPRQQHQRRRAAQPAAQHQQVTRSVGRWKPRPFNSPSALPLRLLPKPTLPEIETPSPASLAESDTENDSPVIVSTVRTAWPARPPQQRTQQRQHPAAAARPRQPSRGRTQHPHPAAAAAAAPVARVVGQQPQQPTAASHGHYSGRGYSGPQPAAASSPHEPATAADEPIEWKNFKTRMAKQRDKKRQSKNTPLDQTRSHPPRKVSKR